MSNYDNTNRGQAWGNDKKTTDNHPDLKGSINIEGKEYWLSMWKRKPDANPKAPAVSMKVQPKEAQPEQQHAPQQQQQPPPTGMDGFDDDIPF